MAYLNRNDIPFHFALADAFTICDAYHCSFMGATDPNRYHLWTGWIGNDGKNGDGRARGLLRAPELDAKLRRLVRVAAGEVKIRLGNSGKAAAVFQVRSGNATEAPWTYTVSPHARIVESFAVRAKGRPQYDFSVFGPNGYFRLYKGSVEIARKANLRVDTNCESDHGLTLDIRNKSNEVARLSIFDAYKKRSLERVVAPHQSLVWHFDLEDSHGWYDLSIELASDSSFKQQLAGHVESGKDSMTHCWVRDIL